jgi:hypothetical protein
MTPKKMLVDQFAELGSAVHRALPRDVDVETAQFWILNQDRLKAALAAALVLPKAETAAPEAPPAEVPAIEYFTPLPDADVSEHHQVTLVKYRRLAAEHGVPATTAVCYRVRAGFTLKTHAPKAGPCHDGFAYLQSWGFPDEPTSDSLVFWVPRILGGSTCKTKDQQIALLADLRGKLELPAHHMSGFGKVSLLAGLILAHCKATGERVPLNGLWVRTDTCRAVGSRLGLGWHEAGLHCGRWRGDGKALDTVGAFVLGVELGS